MTLVVQVQENCCVRFEEWAKHTALDPTFYCAECQTCRGRSRWGPWLFYHPVLLLLGPPAAVVASVVAAAVVVAAAAAAAAAAAVAAAAAAAAVLPQQLLLPFQREIWSPAHQLPLLLHSQPPHSNPQALARAPLVVREPPIHALGERRQ